MACQSMDGEIALTDHDERLAELLEQLADESRDGGQPDLEAVVRERAGWDDFYDACRALDA